MKEGLQEPTREETRHDGRPSDEERGRYAYEGLTRLVHERARLGLLVALAGEPEGLAFLELRRLCALSDGNLSRHLQALAEAGLVALYKGSAGARARTLARLTPAGERRLRAHLEELERVQRDAREALEQRREMGEPGPPPEGFAPV